ncbi:MAG: hypothetical protein QGH15_09820 [Kiritimatiellia bacterium]|nr:hypothetical protein [Kiritimatiellia bacterium]
MDAIAPPIVIAARCRPIRGMALSEVCPDRTCPQSSHANPNGQSHRQNHRLQHMQITRIESPATKGTVAVRVAIAVDMLKKGLTEEINIRSHVGRITRIITIINGMSRRVT